MRIRSWIAMLGVMAVVGCYKSEGTIAPAPVVSEPVIKVRTYLALGDSYTIGQSIDSAGRYPAQVAGLLAADSISITGIKYIATTGWTTQNLIDAINNAHLTATYDLVTLLIGVNDQYQHVDTGTYRVHFTQLLQTSVSLANNNKQHVVVLSIPDYGVTPFAHGDTTISHQIDVFNAINKRITDSVGVSYVDVTTLSRAAGSDASLLASDGLHYSAKEYGLWAGLLEVVMR